MFHVKHGGGLRGVFHVKHVGWLEVSVSRETGFRASVGRYLFHVKQMELFRERQEAAEL